jgi:predicted nuclease of predicted toxin-antitoxin system
MTGFLFDANLPDVSGLDTELPISHAASLGERMTDSAIREHARKKNLVIVTKNADFSQRIILAEPPPRVVHLRIGNMRRREFELWIQRCWPRIEAAAKSHKLVNVFLDRIQSVR